MTLFTEFSLLFRPQQPNSQNPCVKKQLEGLSRMADVQSSWHVEIETTGLAGYVVYLEDKAEPLKCWWEYNSSHGDCRRSGNVYSFSYPISSASGNYLDGYDGRGQQGKDE